MKKIISIILVSIIGITIIPKTLINEKHIVLESTTSVYTKEEVDSLLSTIRTNITNNTNEIINIKNELTTLKNSLSNYALKTSLNTTNSNIDNINTVVADNTARIEALEALGTSNVIKIVGKSEYNFSLFSSTATSKSVTISDTGISIYVKGSAYNNAIAASNDYFDFTNINYILLSASSQYTGWSTTIAFPICLIDENGNVINLTTIGQQLNYTFQHYIDVSEYTGNYRLGVGFRLGGYESYGTGVINDLILI